MSSISDMLHIISKMNSPLLTVHPNRCLFVRNRNAECLRCADVCTTGALSKSEDGISVDPEKCIGCGICAKTCTHEAITVESNLAYIDFNKCKLCRECEAMCPTGAIHEVNFPKPLDKEALKARVAERKRKAQEAAAAAKAEKESQEVTNA